MKRNNLTTAVLAGIAGIAGIAGSAQAVNINPDGLGQVLLYPFYTTNNGNQTLLSVVNTTNAAKAVKVRFLESLNSREVLDFNLYLSAYDVWVAAIFDNAGTPTLLTGDSSCTVPYFFGNGNGLGAQPFLNFAYIGADADASPERGSITRASEGHFEIIEMGEMLPGPFADAVTHVQGALVGPPPVPAPAPNEQVPANCDLLVAAWTAQQGNDGAWVVDSSVGMTDANGGLFGGAAIVNSQAGTMYSYDAKAINGFWDPAVAAGIRHSRPGDELPSLTSGDATTANIFDDAGNAIPLMYGQSIEAVSALFMHDQLMNEYVILDSLAAQSEWVITFPTKRFYTDPAFNGGSGVVMPFTSARTSSATACEDFTIDFYDREEGTPTDAPPGSRPPTVSPEPPVEIPPGAILFELCAETNVIRFDQEEEGEAQTPAVPIVGTNGFDSLVTFGLPVGYDAGWANINMVPYVNGDPIVPPVPPAVGIPSSGNRMDSEGMLGLPVIGQWFEAFTNGTLQGGTVLANYGGVFEHKGTRAQQ